MGSGKSTVGRRVAELAGVEFADLDQRVEAAEGRPVAAIFAAGGEAAFRRAELRELDRVLAPGRVVALGGGAPLQEAIWSRVHAEGVTVYLAAPLEVLRARLGTGAGRPLAAGGDHDALARLLAAREHRYREAAHTVDATAPAETVAEEVLRLWSA